MDDSRSFYSVHPTISCNNCEWYAHGEFSTHNDIKGGCHFFPRVEEKGTNDWCGQFEKRKRENKI